MRVSNPFTGEVLNDCGTGRGGFKSGNTCARRSGSGTSESLISYHVTSTPIKKLSDHPMWVSLEKEVAEAHAENTKISMKRRSYLYEVRVKGRILSQEEARRAAEEAGVGDFRSLTAELVSKTLTRTF